MKTYKRNLYATCISVLLGSMSFGMVSPFFAPLVKKLGVVEGVEFWSGLIFSASYFTGALFSPLWGSLADKYGRKIMMIRASFGSAVIYFLISICTNNYQLLILQLIIGILAGFVPACITFIATNTKEEKIGVSLSLLHIATAIGYVVGPIVGGILISKYSFGGIFRIAGFILAISSLIIALWVRESKEGLTSQRSNIFIDFKQCFQNKPLFISVMVVFTTEVALYLAQPVLALYIGELRSSMDINISTGIVFSLVGIAAIITATFWGILGERYGLKIIVTITLLGAAIFSLPQLMVTTVVQFIGWRFIYGLFAGGLTPNINTLVARTSPYEFRARAFGISASVTQMAGFVGPLLGGTVASVIGMKGVFAITSLVLLGIVLLVKKVELNNIKLS